MQEWGDIVYKDTGYETVIRLEDGVFIAKSSEEYIKWLAGGNAPLPPESLQTNVPQEVTMRQARLELNFLGKLSQVQTLIDAIPDTITRQSAQIEWDYSNAVQRHNPFVEMLGTQLGLDMDAVFIAAAKR